MPTTLNPDGTVPSSVKGWARVAIDRSTNTAPIVVSVTGPGHGFNTGDTVGVEGHAINTAANGLWIITVQSANAYSLNGSTGNGAGTTTGYALDYSVLPQLTLPSDGDLVNASADNTPIEGSAGIGGPWMYKRTGAYAVYGLYTIATEDSNWASGPTNWLTGTQSGSASWGDIATLTYGGLGSNPAIAQTGDVFVLTFTTTVALAGAFAFVPIGLGVTSTVEPAAPSAATIITGSAFAVPKLGSTVYTTLTLTAVYTAVAGDANKRIDFSLMMFGNGAGPDTYAFSGDHQLVIQHLRPNT